MGWVKPAVTGGGLGDRRARRRAEYCIPRWCRKGLMSNIQVFQLNEELDELCVPVR